jgi:hypothetical protein
MTISINSNVFNKYREVMDFFLEDDNFSRICTINYPPIKEICEHCQSLAGSAVNSYQHGGPAPFNFNSCDYCGGSGYREKESTTTIRLRIYWNKKDWIKHGNIVLPDAQCMIIGKIEDLKNLMNAQFISIISEENIMKMEYTLACEPFFHGFGKKNYFVAYLQRA